jgi:uncharacterized protein
MRYISSEDWFCGGLYLTISHAAFIMHFFLNNTDKKAMKTYLIFIILFTKIIYADDIIISKSETVDVHAQLKLAKSYLYGRAVKKNSATAILWYKKAARQNNEEALLALAGMYNFGLHGVVLDQQEAVKWWLKADAIDSTPAQSYLGNAFFFGRGAQKDRKKGIEYWIKAANKGQYVAQYYLAEVHFYGVGRPQNTAEAFKWYEKSAAQGYHDAFANLAVCYFKGYGTKEDQQMAKDVLEIAVNKNNTKAKKVWLDLKMAERPDKIPLIKKYITPEATNKRTLQEIDTIIKKAKKGEQQAQFELANCYFSGIAVPQNTSLAISWLNKSVDQGNLLAQTLLGMLYIEARHIKRDLKKGFAILKDAAEKGNTRSQFSLCVLYFKGVGTETDIKAGRKWLLKAIEGNDVYALMLLSQYYKKGQQGFPRNEIKAELLMKRASYSEHPKALFRYAEFFMLFNYSKGMKYLKKAAKQGHGEAMYFLSLAYLNGMFQVTKNHKLGMDYLKKSAQRGYKDAIARLAELEKK